MQKIALFFSAILMISFGLPLSAQPPAYYSGGYYPYPPHQRGYGEGYLPRGIHFEQDRDENGYYLRIYTKGYSPDAIAVTIDGPFLLLQNQESQQTENRSERSYSFSTRASSMRRRFRIPRNADVSAMQRSEQDGVVVITLPYRQ